MGQNYSADHVFVAATYVTVPARLAGQAAKRGTIRLPQETKVSILEVLCLQCRRPYDAVEGQPCEAANSETRDHLMGGTAGSSATGTRARRKHPYHDCSAVGCTLGGSVVDATG